MKNRNSILPAYMWDTALKEVGEMFKLLFTNNRKKLCSNFHKRAVSQKFLTHRTVACVASVSVRFQSKEQGTRVKDHAKNGARKRTKGFLPPPPPPSPFIFWLSFHFLHGQNRKSCSTVFLCSETKRKRLLRRLTVPTRNQHWNKSNLFLSCKWHRTCPRFTARVPKFRSVGPKMNRMSCKWGFCICTSC